MTGFALSWAYLVIGLMVAIWAHNPKNDVIDFLAAVFAGLIWPVFILVVLIRMLIEKVSKWE